MENLWHRAHPDRFGVAADHRRTDGFSLWRRTRPTGVKYHRSETGLVLDLENPAVANCALLCLTGCFDGLLRSAQCETTLPAMAKSRGAVRHDRLDRTSGLLRLYFHFFTSYAKTYGSLGAVMVLLTWLYVTGTMLLLGAEVNMTIEVAAVRARAFTDT
jgi:hypothetical protein